MKSLPPRPAPPRTFAEVSLAGLGAVVCHEVQLLARRPQHVQRLGDARDDRVALPDDAVAVEDEGLGAREKGRYVRGRQTGYLGCRSGGEIQTSVDIS